MFSEWPRAIGPLAFLLCGWWLVYSLAQPNEPKDALVLQQFQDANGAPVTLPVAEIAAGSAATRLRSTVAFSVLPSDPYAVFVGHAVQATVLTVNGSTLERLPLRPGADLVSFRQSFLYLIPPGILRTGPNTLDFVLQTSKPALAELDAVWLGPRAPLEALFRDLYASRVTLTQVTAITAALITLFAALLWLARPRETLYGWFALGASLWLVYLFHFVWYRAPLSSDCWMAFIHVCIAGSLLAIRHFVRRFLDQPLAPVDRWLDYLTVLAAALMIAISILWPDTRLYDQALNGWFRLGLLLLGGHLAVVQVRACWQTRRVEVYWLAASSILGISLGIFDSAVIAGWLPPSTSLIFHLGILPLVSIFGYILLRRFISVLEYAEATNITLDQRVQDKSAALEREFRARQRLEREKLLADERHRLATDLHDGAGSQLVSLLAAVRREGMDRAQMEAALSEAIADLRLVMDSIDSLGSDLAQALGQFRSRIEPRLAATGLKSVWRTLSLRDGLRLSPRRTLSIFRALQEALVNVVKHAEASEVLISARDIGSILELTIRDNGKGLPKVRPAGRGLQNLEQRARNLGGYIKLVDSNPGLEVQLFLPIPGDNETKP